MVEGKGGSGLNEAEARLDPVKPVRMLVNRRRQRFDGIRKSANVALHAE